TDTGERIVDGRELHNALEVSSRFADWIKNRISKYGFVENEDFVTVSNILENGGRQIDYVLKIDMAKELAMVENNEQGRKARRYFIAVEKKLESLTAPSYMIDDPVKRAEKWIKEQKERQAIETKSLMLEQRVNELQPKATYYDMVLQNKSLLTITKIAKDYGMSGQALNTLLNDLGVQYKQGDIWLLYAKYQDKGYTQTSTHVIDADNSKITTKWTQKGRLFIYDL